MAVELSKNPTLQVVWLPKTRRMEEAMTEVRETHTLAPKRSNTVEKSVGRVLDREKFNVLLKRTLSESKVRGVRNHNVKKDPLKQIDFNKQIEEIEILVDILKGTGNGTQKRIYTPLVHVPLPKGRSITNTFSSEFYELKPLIKIKHSTTKSKTKEAGGQETTRESISRTVARNVGASRHAQPPTKPHVHPVATTTIVKQEKEKVDKSTLTSSRLLSVREGEAPKVVGRQQEVVRIIKSEIEVEEKVGQFEESVLREMSTISSDPAQEAALSSSESFDIVYRHELNDPVDEKDLFLMENTWTILELEKDPLENARQVVVMPKSPKLKPQPELQLTIETTKDKETQLIPKASEVRHQPPTNIGVKREAVKKVTYSDEFEKNVPDSTKVKTPVHGAKLIDKTPKLVNETKKMDEQPITGDNDRTETKDRPKHRKSKSHKRSKKNLPNVQLSDYKGFYVVHTTNDWSFS